MYNWPEVRFEPQPDSYESDTLTTRPLTPTFKDYRPSVQLIVHCTSHTSTTISTELTDDVIHPHALSVSLLTYFKCTTAQHSVYVHLSSCTYIFVISRHYAAPWQVPPGVVCTLSPHFPRYTTERTPDLRTQMSVWRPALHWTDETSYENKHSMQKLQITFLRSTDGLVYRTQLLRISSDSSPRRDQSVARTCLQSYSPHAYWRRVEL